MSRINSLDNALFPPVVPLLRARGANTCYRSSPRHFIGHDMSRHDASAFYLIDWKRRFKKTLPPGVMAVEYLRLFFATPTRAYAALVSYARRPRCRQRHADAANDTMLILPEARDIASATLTLWLILARRDAEVAGGRSVLKRLSGGRAGDYGGGRLR